MDIDERCNKAIAILQSTNDGNDLSQKDLYIVQSAVNGYLNELGYKHFNKIYKKYGKGVKHS
jgi:hypothetical protein